MNTTLKIVYGAVADPIDAQLREQGMPFNIEIVRWFQSDLDAITRLAVRGLLTDAARERLHKKLHARITAHVSKLLVWSRN